MATLRRLVRAGSARRVACAPGICRRPPRRRRRHPHRNGRAGLRCRHFRHLDRGDQQSAPHHGASVSIRTRTGHRHAVGDPAGVCLNGGPPPRTSRPIAGQRHQDSCRDGSGTVPGLGRRGAQTSRFCDPAARVRRRISTQRTIRPGVRRRHRARARRPPHPATKSKTDQEGRGEVKALPYTESHETCPPCAYVRWAQVVAAFDAGDRPSVIRLLRNKEPFDAHVCRGGVPRTAARAPLLRTVATNGNLGNTALSGSAIHQTIRRHAEHADYAPTALAKLGGHSLRAGSSPKAPATAPTDPPSPDRPDTPASTPSRCTAANTPHSSETPLTILGFSAQTTQTYSGICASISSARACNSSYSATTRNEATCSSRLLTRTVVAAS